MATRRTRGPSGLSDRLRAEVFAADKGMCAYTGKSLWVLDHGIVPLIEWDWVDHVRPLSKGGDNSIENLICCGSFRNWIKGNNSRDEHPMLRRGRPTEDCLWHAETYSDDIFNLIERHAAMDVSDWYFNRAILNILTWAYNYYDRVQGEPKLYWCGSAWKRLAKWQELNAKSKLPSFERRGLVRYPRSADVRLLLRLRTVQRYSEFDALATEIYAHFKSNYDVYVHYLEAKTVHRRLTVSKNYRQGSPNKRSAAMVDWLSVLDRRHAALDGQLVSFD